MNTENYRSSTNGSRSHRPHRRRHYVRVSLWEMVFNPFVAFRVFAGYCEKIYTNWHYLNRCRMMYPM